MISFKEVTGCGDFNPRPPCGDRHADNRDFKKFGKISIHDPRAGIDQNSPNMFGSMLFISIHDPRAGLDSQGFFLISSLLSYFNPRPPCGDRRDGSVRRGFITSISIHDPRAGIDCKNS